MIPAEKGKHLGENQVEEKLICPARWWLSREGRVFVHEKTRRLKLGSGIRENKHARHNSLPAARHKRLAKKLSEGEDLHDGENGFLNDIAVCTSWLQEVWDQVEDIRH